ncbi:uncharacterized protein LOC135838202 [Planococcus citri]|uniref:uncharacterized protein LOC135838202 n=1 Tax=Planococcus citri TaxID=170843 RepID=UPI0031F772AC
MYIYAHLFNLHIYLTILLTSGASTPEKREVADHNPDQDFRCDDGHYLARIFVCDGIPDCYDNSDETRDQCGNISCNDRKFQCGYGACISKEYLCDGLKQCIDGSDETAHACNKTLIRESNRSKRDAGDSCPKLPPSLNKVITYDCNETSSKSCDAQEGYVPKFTSATTTCKPGYFLEKNHSYSICHRNKWLPPFENSCFKKCEKLNPVNVDMKCNRRGRNIPCNEDSLLAGSKVRPVCKELHTYGDFVPDYREITCNENGKWDKTLFSCIPECGRPYTNPEKLIKGGLEEPISESPWHVAIYNEKKELICGGTIISPYIVLSAAHCFEDDDYKPTTNTTNYEVVTSKFSRNYCIKDNRNQKVFKIKEIRFAEEGDFSNIYYYQADIVALILKEKLDISGTVFPACIDWIGRYNNASVSGWDKIEYEGEYSENLTTVNVPFISRKRCGNIVPDDFMPYITFDKFCTGKEGGYGVTRGYGGAGFLLRDGPFYHLRGIASVKQASNSSIAAFTGLAYHIDWILRLRDEVNSIMSEPSKINSLDEVFQDNCGKNGQICVTHYNCSNVSDLINSTIAVPRGFRDNVLGKNVTNIIPAFTPPPPPVIRGQDVISSNISSRNSTAVALQKCEEYGKYRYVEQWRPPKLPGHKGRYYRRQRCVSVDMLMPERIWARPKEYPHMAIIGYGNDYESVIWECGGSLISEKFVMSAAHCSSTVAVGPARWVLLGDLTLSSTTDDARPKVYRIVKIHDHPNYKAPSVYNDISLFELNTTVEFSPYVRPACLYTSTADFPADTKAKITGWGTTEKVEQKNDRLLKATIYISEHQKCGNILEVNSTRASRGYDSSNMICAGDTYKGRDTCLGDSQSEGPLQIWIPGQVCMWNIIGVASVGPGICGNSETPRIYTKVSHYLDWIQSIIWP